MMAMDRKTRGLSRREFLKRSGAALICLALPPSIARASTGWSYQQAPASLGRISTWVRQAVREEPSPSARLVAWKSYDEIVPLYAAVVGEGPWPTNPIWYRTEGGFIHSGYVQPVENMPAQDVIEQVDEPGFWAQVCVPIAEVRYRPDSPSVVRKLYYGTVYRVAGIVTDASGREWYQLREGYAYSPASSHVLASSLRPVPAEDLSPISYRLYADLVEVLAADTRQRPYKLAEVDEAMDALAARSPEKRIEINLREQSLTCFEDGQPVFSTRISSGIGGPTPRGEYRVIYKRHTQRMIGPDYDLPGVSFPTYFTPSGIAIHGTYWHNDYGRPHSHGCINVTNEAARWVFRWTDPPVPYQLHTLLVRSNKGTRVVVY